jgi:hypothetical protein
LLEVLEFKALKALKVLLDFKDQKAFKDAKL